MSMGKLDDMIIEESIHKKVKRIFKEKPTMYFDNYFSHVNTSDLADKKGYSFICIVSCDCLPKSVPAQYMCKKRTNNHNHPARCAQFNQPIAMVKEMADEETGNIYQKVHVTFQPTSSCNI
eukprot:11866232-Ditylum_brightwellii.AAC.1